MFTKPENEIEFSDIEDFCREFGEGVRVEYKQQMIKDIPKIVSSFANTLGGIFIIGAEADKRTNKVIAIDGIPNSGGLEEQILQSALTGIYPAVMPEVIILDVPTNPNNVVIIIRVDESPQAPHAIQNSTRVYIRTGSITQPYELAEIDRIEYMLKRRDDSQARTRQILKQIEERIESSLDTDSQDFDTNSPYLDTNFPNLTVIAHPIFPYRPLISTGDIYEFSKDNRFLRWNHQSDSMSRVAGGFFTRTLARIDGASRTYRELNEYGIVYQRFVLRQIPHQWPDEEQYLMPNQFVGKIGELIQLAQSFYKKCEYSGNIEITAQLRRVFGENLMLKTNQFPVYIKQQRSFDSEILASIQCLPHELVKAEKFVGVVNELAGQLLWAFNVDEHEWSEKTVGILREYELVGPTKQ